MMRTLQYGNTDIPYRSSYTDRATLAIHVHPDTSITVEAPLGTPFTEIEKRMHKRAAWILRRQREFERYSFDLPPRQYVSRETHLFLGQQYRLKVIRSESVEKVAMDSEQIYLQTKTPEDWERKRRIMTKWYRQQAREVFEERLVHWDRRLDRFGVQGPQVVVRQMKSRWGSCTQAGKITLNLKLIQVQKPLIDYVIVHELCHLVEHNHAQAFYALLSRIMPDWEQRREKLVLESGGE